jgi:hypothetical protein
MPRAKTLEVPILVKFDELLLAGVERERRANPRGIRPDGTPKLTPRTVLIRALVREGLSAREASRGEESPHLEPAGELPMESESPPATTN